jgi:YVTN family beta-propeller protein
MRRALRHRRITGAVVTSIVMLGAVTGSLAQSTPTNPLDLEFKIPLGNVGGRIDHMTIDLARHRLFVAELGNSTVGVIDLEARKVVHRITGLSYPQGVAYLPGQDLLYVANGGDGSLASFRGADYLRVGRIDLGEDADNIRVDPTTNQLFVGYGSGAIGVVDPQTGSKIKTFPLKVHPESFQINGTAGEIFVNLPDARSVAVLNRESGVLRATWTMRYNSNFAMAIDHQRQRVLVVFRNPPKLVALDEQTGGVVAEADVCGDADDMFIDPPRHQIYISCGTGFIDVLDVLTDDRNYKQLAHIPTVSGARTALFVPEINRLLLGVRARFGESAATWVYRAAP